MDAKDLSFYTRYNISWKWMRGPHLEKKLSAEEGKSILNGGGGGVFIRNTYDFDCDANTSYWHLIKDSFNGFEETPSKYRSRLRKSLDTYEFKIVTKQYAAMNCYETHRLAAENYRVRTNIPSEKQFKEHILSLNDDRDIWVCIHKETGNVAGFAINHIIDDMCDYASMKYHPAFLKPISPAYGLIYRMNEYYLVEKGLKYVDDGARSITEHSDIQSFLVEKFRFRRAYCHVQMIYKWWFGIVVKVLYPLRRIIPFNSIKAVLFMEEIARSN